MRLAINAISTKMGGAATYLSNGLLPILAELEPVLQWPVILWGGASFERLDVRRKQLDMRINAAASRGGLARLVFDHIELPGALARDRVDVLFSTTNIGPLRLRCKHALLVRNAAPFSDLYLSRMPNLKIRMRLRMTRWLIDQSLSRAHLVIFPSAAMRDAAMGTAKKDTPDVILAPYGTRHDLFFPSRESFSRADRELRVLNVSYYSDQKNLGALRRHRRQF